MFRPHPYCGFFFFPQLLIRSHYLFEFERQDMTSGKVIIHPDVLTTVTFTISPISLPIFWLMSLRIPKI